MSCFVTRPAWPVPSTSARSTSCSAAILRTSGVDLRRRRSSADSSRPSPDPPAGAAAFAAGADAVASATFAGFSSFGGAAGSGLPAAGAAPFSVSM
jgi:hypothetical protein